MTMEAGAASHMVHSSSMVATHTSYRRSLQAHTRPGYVGTGSSGDAPMGLGAATSMGTRRLSRGGPDFSRFHMFDK